MIDAPPPGPGCHPVLLAPATGVPNNQRLALLIHRAAIPGDEPDKAAACERLFGRHGWPADWRDTIYTYEHFHSRCHEALGVACGWALLRLGGDAGFELEVRAGDVLVLPAGTGHQRLAASDDFLVVGAYPEGSDYDLLRSGTVDPAAVHAGIAAVPTPSSDPVLGQDGGVASLWRGA